MPAFARDPVPKEFVLGGLPIALQLLRRLANGRLVGSDSIQPHYAWPNSASCNGREAALVFNTKPRHSEGLC